MFIYEFMLLLFELQYYDKECISKYISLQWNQDQNWIK